MRNAKGKGQKAKGKRQSAPLQRSGEAKRRTARRCLFFPFIFFLFPFSFPLHARADIAIDGDRLKVSTDNLIANFRGADLVGLTNRVTHEQYVRTLTPLASMLDMTMLRPPGTLLRCSGWRQGKATNANTDAAQTTLNDLTRTVNINILVDPQTQDIVITLWGEANREGVTGLTWGIRGLDLAAGRLILPAQGGRYADKAHMPSALTLDYPTQWEAQMLLYERENGGLVVYSRDDQALFKKLHLVRKGDYADVGFETEAAAPWLKAGGAPHLEWRINAYRGDWRVPAAGYRNLMHFLRKPVEAKGGRAWVKEIRTVTTIHADTFDPKLLDALAKRLDPRKTLLYLPNWRRDGCDENYPDYTPKETLRFFVERAHERGFRVMLHTSLPGVTPTNPDFARVQRSQVKDARDGKKPLEIGTGASSFAIINPASSAYRALSIARLRPMVAEIRPDALHLGVSGSMFNDGNGLIEDKNFIQGSIALHRALLSAFPDVALGGESINEQLSPYAWFAQRWNDGPLPPHPICAFLFGDHVLSYGQRGQPNPDQSPTGFLPYFALYEGQGVAPTPVLSSAAELADDRPGMQRLLRQARAFQDRDFEPDWSADWKGALFRWRDSFGVTAVVERVDLGVQFKVGEELLYRRVRGVNPLVTPQFIPGWPAYDDTMLYGLDPERDYWLETLPRPKEAVHLADLPRGVRVAGAHVTPDFALFALAGSERAGGASGKIILPAGAQPAFAVTGGGGKTTSRPGEIAFTEMTLPASLVVFLKEGQAVAPGQDLLMLPHDASLVFAGLAAPGTIFGSGEVGEAICGGVKKPRALNAHPPLQGQTAFSWLVKLPDAEKVALHFSAGLADGSKTAGVGFAVRLNGEKVWEWTTKESGWKDSTLDLSPWRNQTVLLQLVTDAQGDNFDDWAKWADVAVR